MIVNEIEFLRVLKDLRNVQTLPDLGGDTSVFFIAGLTHPL